MEYFSTASKWVSEKSSQSYVSFAVFLIILVWAIAGIPLHFREIWYLMIDTASAVISILMLFLIQNSQNRHTIAIQRSEEHTSELQSLRHLVCRLLLEK